MTIEERLKEYILSRFGTIKDFSRKCGLPYGTVIAILRRGIANSTLDNVLTMCRVLGISADELAEGEGRIVLISDTETPLQSTDLVPALREMIATGNYTIGGKEITGDDVETLTSALEIAVAMIKRRKS